MKYFDEETQTYKDVVIKSIVNPVNEYSSSDKEVYSCDYINNINNQLIQTGKITVTTTSNNSPTSLVANVPSGYSFLCWLTPSSNGNVNSGYTENPFSARTNLWVTTANGGTGAKKFEVGYLLIKNIESTISLLSLDDEDPISVHYEEE